MKGITNLLWITRCGRFSSMFGLTGTPPRGQRHPMSQPTSAVEDKTDLQRDTPAVAQLQFKADPSL